MIGADGSALRRIGRGYTAAAWSPVADELVAARANGHGIQLMRPDGTVIRALTRCGKRCEDSAPTWSPDGRFMAV